jgi:hypothetical protein
MTFWAWCLSAMEHTRSPNLLMRSKWKWRKSHLRCTRRDTQDDTRHNTTRVNARSVASTAPSARDLYAPRLSGTCRCT